MTVLPIQRVKAFEWALEIYALQEICLPADTPCDVSFGDWWLAFDDDEPVAFACSVQSRQWTDGCYLARAGVHPAYRGRGLQRRLIRVRLARAKQRGFTRVVSDTHDNPVSANNLIRSGFTLYEPTTPYGFPGTNYFIRSIT